MDFEYRKNSDGSFALYNTEVGDIYFSNIGAYKEAIEKFVLPAEPKNIKKKKIKILDVCYGMGYNSKAFVNYCENNNLNFEYEIDCLELDKNILAFGLLNFDDNIPNDINIKFGYDLLEQIDLTKNIEDISGENWIDYVIEDLETKLYINSDKFCVEFIKNRDLNEYLHNIYYQNHDKFHISDKKIHLNYILGDLLQILPTLTNKYDLIFHDAFSIKKQPELWSSDVLKYYYDLLLPSGKFLTYSKSVVMRKTLLSIGFDVKLIFDGNRKNSTVGIKI